MRHHLALAVDAPAEAVFAAYIDPELVPRWRPAIAAIDELSGSMGEVGTTFVTRYRGRLPASRGEVIAAEPARRHVLAGRGAAAYRAELSLAPDGTGTRLTFGLDARAPGGPLGRILERLFLERKVARDTDADFQRFKALVEQRR